MLRKIFISGIMIFCLAGLAFLRAGTACPPAGSCKDFQRSQGGIAAFILKNFSDLSVKRSVLRSFGDRYEMTPDGIIVKDGYVEAPDRSQASLKPEEMQALEALCKRPEFVFSRDIRDGYALRYGGRTIRVRHIGGKAEASIENSALVYRNAYRDTDVLYLLGGSEEMILLYSKDSPTRFVYECKAGLGSEADINKKGELTFGDLTLSKPEIIDSSGRRAEGRYEKAGGNIVLAFNPEGLKYPIIIDPAWRNSGSTLSDLRTGHTATLLPSGKVLIVGGYGDSLPTNDAELFDPVTGTFAATGPINYPRNEPTATLLPNGTVLIAGGEFYGVEVAEAEIYDPASGTFNFNYNYMNTARTGHTATLLPNGTVLIAGGITNYGNDLVQNAEIYDPGYGGFSTIGGLNYPRWDSTATLLPNGTVLIAGGTTFNGMVVTTLLTAEVYDPGSYSFTPTGSLNTGRERPTATLLANGAVLIAGGWDRGPNPPNIHTFYSSAELYSPSGGTFTQTTGSMSAGRTLHTATLLPNGKVLISGGYTDGSGALSGSELYDPTSQTFSSAGSMNHARMSHTATLLADGKVFISGGADTAEEYDPSVGTFNYTGSMTVGRAYHTATLLPDGKVLIAGGMLFGGGNASTSEVYNPSSGTFSLTTGSMATARRTHTATLLATGKVLLAGGYSFGDPSSLSSAELYDPTTGTFLATTGPMITTRSSHTATLLADGRVLLAGGGDFPTSNPGTAEIYDASTGTFEATGNMVILRSYHTATLLPNGKVLITGGRGGADSGHSLYDAELYNPSTGTLASTGSLAAKRELHTATLLPNGKVLIAGGFDFDPSQSLSSAELYDPSAGTFTATGSLTSKRQEHTATLLPNGKVLIAGGQNNGTMLTSAELYDPSTGSFTAGTALQAVRTDHTATLLPNGKVLLAGGTNFEVNLSSAELVRYTEYDYTNKNMQPSISAVNGASSFPVSVRQGTAYTLTGTEFKGTSEASGGNGFQNSSTNYPRIYLQKMDTGNANSMAESGMLLDVTTSEYPIAGWSGADSSISFTTPADLPAGYYLLTVVANAVPSDAKIVYFNPSLAAPSHYSGPEGMMIYNTTTHHLYIFNGTTWEGVYH
jgi:WD40 repeat protein